MFVETTCTIPGGSMPCIPPEVWCRVYYGTPGCPGFPNTGTNGTVAILAAVCLCVGLLLVGVARRPAA